MSRITPLPREALSEFEPLFQLVEERIGFVPNNFLIMGRSPELLRSFAALCVLCGRFL